MTSTSPLVVVWRWLTTRLREKYFEAHGIEYVKLVFSGNEVDKNLSDVEQVLLALKQLEDKAT